MFVGDDEDGDFLLPTGGAKLASLFGVDQDASPGNESFHYTAPKQPRKSSASVLQTAAPSPGAPSVLFATAVLSFRYINGQYVKQGKLGAAILGNHATKEYKLLLYLSQQKQVAAAKIHSGFVFTVQSNNYCTFYDDQRQNWSLMFESEQSSSDFCKEVCLAKANSCNVLDAVVSQDLSLGEGQAVDYGDSLEVSYRGWLLQNHTFGQMFDSNQNSEKLLRMKVGGGKVLQGWEKGVLGMKKAGRRLIVVPPTLAYGSKGAHDGVPANSTLIFQATLRRVKFSKETGSDQASASSRESGAVSPASSVENITLEPPEQTLDSGKPEESPVRAKSNSLSEQLNTPDATKAKLISRMAKMGQPMLPFLTGVSCQPESCDSDLEDTNTGRTKDPPSASSPVQISTAAPAPTHALPHPYPSIPANVLPTLTNFASQVVLPGNMRAFQPYAYTHTSVPATQLQSLSHVYPAQPVSHIGSGDVNSFLITEARQHNMEIRLTVGKVADKVDQLASKIDDLQKQGSVSLGLSGISMDSCMVMQNIQRIIQENECLKKEVFEKSSRIEEQNRKISELLNQSQRYMEHSNMLLEQRHDSLKSSSEQNQARLLQAERDKIQLREELSSTTTQLSQMQLEASAHEQKVLELQSELSTKLLVCESHAKHINGLESQLQELKERAQAHDHAEEQRRKEMELKVNTMEEKLHELKTDKHHLERSCHLQAEQLEEEWKSKYEQALATARQHHDREMAELKEERNQLLEKLQEPNEKCKELGTHRDFAKETQERQVTNLETKPSEQQSSVDTAAEVKRVMNGVFHSLRGQFDHSESYTGHEVLSVLVNTIKNVTLNLLSGKDELTTKEELPSQKEDRDDGTQKEEKIRVSKQKETLGDPKNDDQHTSDAQIQQPLSDSKTQLQSEALESTQSVASTESKAQEMAASETEMKPEQGEHDTSEAGPQEGIHTEVEQEGSAALSEVLKEREEDQQSQRAGRPDSHESFGTPVKPPPPPLSKVQVTQGEDQSPTGDSPKENGDETFSQLESIDKSTSQPIAEEEEDEQSLKGCPPPPPLFDDDGDKDLDWL
ncbi:FK506-binding protein 15 [Dunckerocampus dactyliophorus]|uniref:FK506-binding protein 15 n=1 Tax=Dunckerocampus dactyliophorus TaxID=161453 RepID=UPI002405C1DC|nr:FK506-binding protein 15 [Dunckerocampus dactyliophorus]